ncbi:YggS family pyridoxal phosphate-dependent enzyme [Dyella flava]|uniref:Pyridoxal phosphate homeostasis protein n=1 Tax=Dyella flava TaxID=1920170 RepID=A0ABS2K5L9_9GAMM|nr:YggS family pyridoxal phosphate-dependent enzyme [Dyella flava]MBM7126506.1 YggS family pyridoxal phosphate-dependent enzyme [Dyella flava]GLQ49676.1 YggS family pyridoxal phosphate enzyme [Dyella flava]
MTDAAQLAANWAGVRRQVDEACRAAGRDPAEVTILPVSKTFGPDAVRAAMALGLHRFGENKVQEIRGKAAVLAGEAIEWVVIGHLQTNKAKDVARLASEVQSLDRLDLAEALDHRLQLEGRRLDVLVQVKTAREESKSGLPGEALPAFLERLRAYPTLRVRGLMTMATLSEDADEVRACFRQLRELRDRCAAEGHDLPRLSMGMSSDFPLAIAEGATEVRIGTAIFGSRSKA